MLRRFSVLAVIAVLFCVPAQTQVSVLAGAITTAIPLIQKVISAIWPKGSESQSVKGTAAPAKATKGLSTDVSAGVTQIEKISTELKTIDDFVLNCSTAERDIATMVATLAGAPSSPSSSQIKNLQFQLDHKFQEAKSKIGNVSKDGAAVKLMDTETAKSLLAIVEANNGQIQQIEGDIKALGSVDSAISTLRADLDLLSGQLSDGMSVAGLTVAQVAQGLDEIAKQGASQAGVKPPPTPSTITPEVLTTGFNSLLKQHYPKLSTEHK